MAKAEGLILLPVIPEPTTGPDLESVPSASHCYSLFLKLYLNHILPSLSSRKIFPKNNMIMI
jgi:hypothetical protein